MLHFIAPAVRHRTVYLRSFHEKFHEDRLNEHSLLTVDDAETT